MKGRSPCLRYDYAEISDLLCMLIGSAVFGSLFHLSKQPLVYPMNLLWLGCNKQVRSTVGTNLD